MLMATVPPQKRPSSDKASSMANTRGLILPPHLKAGGWETNARNHSELCNCQGQGEDIQFNFQER